MATTPTSAAAGPSRAAAPVSGADGEQAGPPDPARSRAGRNLPVAIAVGAVLGAVVLVPLWTAKPVFVAVVAATVCVGLGELTRSLRAAGRPVPLPPLLAGAVLMLVLAYLRGSSALVVGLLLTLLALLAWEGIAGLAGIRLHPGTGEDRAAAQLRTTAVGVLAVLYVPFLASFCALLTSPHDGPSRVTAFVATVVCSDVGGLAAGVLAGRHPLAPSVSPRKSWEGLAGSVATCMLAGALFFTLLLHAAAWQGVVFGLAVAVAAVVGDLGESMLKRDLGVKDMGRLLPAHGGVMDRLDSLLVAAPVAWLLLTAFVPVHG